MYKLDINFVVDRKEVLFLKNILGDKDIQDWYKTNILSGSIDQEKAAQTIEYFYSLMGLNAPEIQFVSSPYTAINFLTQVIPPHPISILPESKFLQTWNKILKKQLNPDILTQLNSIEIEDVLQQLVQQMVMDGFGKELIMLPPQDTDRIGKNLLINKESTAILNPRLLFSTTDHDIRLHGITIDSTQKLLQHLPSNISIAASFDFLESEITANLGKDINPDVWKKIWKKIANYKKSVKYPLFIFRPEALFYIFLFIIFNRLNNDVVKPTNDEQENRNDISEEYVSESPHSFFELFQESLFQDISQQVNKLGIVRYLDNLDEKEYLSILQQLIKIFQNYLSILPFEELFKKITHKINETQSVQSVSSQEHVSEREYLLILQQLISLAQNCGWILPFEKLCIICDRPTSISFDQKGRLHAVGKPAIEFADGNKVYFNHGVIASKKYQVPTQPQKKAPVPAPPVSVTPSSKSSLLTKDNDNLKKILIQSLNVADNCREIHAVLLDVWQNFELVSIKTNLDEQPIHILKRISSSADQLQSQRVPSNIKSAKQAVEWVSWE